ncbi:MAG: hypothetical protein IPK57_04890 [Chitinophagaceae bacterium]|nr:hypothetical protein [Chitinophagaceae bacterium]
MVNNRCLIFSTKKLDNGIYTFTGLYDKEETMLVEQQRTLPQKTTIKPRYLSQLFKCLYNFCN